MTAPNEACRPAQEQRFSRRQLGGPREGAQRDVACEVVDRHGGQRTGLGLRPHLTVGAEEDLLYLVRPSFHLEPGQPAYPVAVLANVGPKLQFHGTSVPLRSTVKKTRCGSVCNGYL